MVKCKESCIPTCQHCIYAEYEQFMFDGKPIRGEATKCKIHPGEVSAAYYCDDFHCFRKDVQKEQEFCNEFMELVKEARKNRNMLVQSEMSVLRLGVGEERINRGNKRNRREKRK